MTEEINLEAIADELVACRKDPEAFVERMFDWQSPELSGKGIEPWQRQVLQMIRDGLPLDQAVRIAIASGHGIGKTALVSLTRSPIRASARPVPTRIAH